MRKIRYTFETNSSSCHGLMVKAKENIDEFNRIMNEGTSADEVPEEGE